MGKENYTGIDIFRLIASLMIIAIHTSPLASFSDIGDFILTRAVARVAVPFFFLTSGYFLITRYSPDTNRLYAFVKKTALIYLYAVMLYIPLNIYNHYFQADNLLPNIIKDIVFDGTMYHLWYLPASIIGAIIAWLLVRKFGFRFALIITLVLYILGLFGDSYYGISERTTFLSDFYKYVFQITDYTRNGILFAPIFFAAGGFLADNPPKISLKTRISGLCVSLIAMITEAVLLHNFGLQRHDSMYLFLLPCSYFLFTTLLYFKGSRIAFLRTISLLIYIIHPMMIVAVRLAAKLLSLQSVLVENSLVHFAAVCAASVITSAGISLIRSKFFSKKASYSPRNERAYIEIDLDNLRHNVNEIYKAIPHKCTLMAVVKASAYGHGLFEISSTLNRWGIKSFAVATIDEGIKLRKYGISGEILILGFTSVYRAAELKKYDLTQTLIDYTYAVDLNRQNIRVKAHIKIDSGMHRLGVDYKSFQEVKDIFSMKKIKVCGIYTHLCCSQSLNNEDIEFTKQQIKCFYSLIENLEQSGITIPKIHIQSSYGLLNYPEIKCDYVRTGIALYGVHSSPNTKTLLKLDLRPVLSLKSRVVLIREVGKGESVGYDRRFTAERDCRVAVIPIGYGDGLPRNLSCGNGLVSIKSHNVPIVGRICMDQLMVDITDYDDITVGDLVKIISSENEDELTAPAVAERSLSISNELLCRMGTRIPVLVKALNGEQ